MPKGSKGQKNGLTFYIITELIPELARKGQTYPNGFKELVPIALPRYQNLPRCEKERYENMAKADKAKMRMNEQADRRRDNMGNVISERVDPRDVMKSKRLQDRQELQTLFMNLSESQLMEEKFYFVGFQFMICTEQQVYYPLEYGLVEWSMTKGVIRKLHGFINPGSIPLGYRYIAKSHSEDTHRIPLDEFKEFDSNYAGIWMQMERFLSQNASGVLPPIYCMEAEFARIQGCLAWLHSHCSMRNLFRVHILEELTTKLFVHKDFPISDTSVFDLLMTSAYDFESSTKCSKHYDVEAKNCALGSPMKYAFALSDALADMYKFDLTANHLPVAPSLASDESVVLSSNNTRLMPQDPVATRHGRTTVEEPQPPPPPSYASRDVRFFRRDDNDSTRSFSPVNNFASAISQGDYVKEKADDDAFDDYDDSFPAITADAGKSNRSSPGNQYPSTFSAVAQSRSDYPPAFMQPSDVSPLAPSKMTQENALAARMRNLEMESLGKKPNNGDASGRLQNPPAATLASVAANFEASPSSYSDLKRYSAEPSDGDLFAASGDAQKPLRPPASPAPASHVVAPPPSNQHPLTNYNSQFPSGRGRTFTEVQQHTMQVQPPRPPGLQAAARGVSEVPISAYGRGRGFAPPVDLLAGVRKPPVDLLAGVRKPPPGF